MVGEGPGTEEMETGRPFVGSTGRQLEISLKEANLKREDLFIVNATCCRPPENKTPAQLRRATNCCRPVLKKQLEGKSQHIFAMGKWAFYSLTGQEKGVSAARGFLHKGWRWPGAEEQQSSTIIPTHHPTYAFFWNPFEWGAWEADLHRFGRLIRDQLVPAPTRLVTNPTVTDIELIAREPFVAVDIETAATNSTQHWTGKVPTRAKLKTVGLGVSSWGLSHWWGTDELVEAAIKKVLEDESILKVGHNYTFFDDRVLRRYGIVTSNYVDTFDQRRALSSTSPLALSYVTSLYTDLHFWKAAEDDK